MKADFAPIMIGWLALTCASPATATPFHQQSGAVSVATISPATDEKTTYLQQTKDVMRVWDQKIHDFNAKLQTMATEATTKASKDLDTAWADTKRAAGRLENAREAHWSKAKASFKSASAKLAAAWHKVSPAVK